jgi:hypothetical protein
MGKIREKFGDRGGALNHHDLRKDSPIDIIHPLN